MIAERTCGADEAAYRQRLMYVEEDRGDELRRLGLALARTWLADGQTPALERAAMHFCPLNLRCASPGPRGAHHRLAGPAPAARPESKFSCASSIRRCIPSGGSRSTAGPGTVATFAGNGSSCRP